MYEKVTDPAQVKKVRGGARFYRYCSVQRDVMEFWEDDTAEVAKLVDDTGRYQSLSTMRNSYASTVRKLGVRIKVLTLDGAVYMVKLQ